MQKEYGNRENEIYVDEKTKLEKSEKEAAQKIEQAREMRAKGFDTLPDTEIRKSITGRDKELQPSDIIEIATYNTKIQLANEQKSQEMGFTPEKKEKPLTRGERFIKRKQQREKNKSRNTIDETTRERDRN